MLLLRCVIKGLVSRWDRLHARATKWLVTGHPLRDTVGQVRIRELIVVQASPEVRRRAVPTPYASLERLVMELDAQGSASQHLKRLLRTLKAERSGNPLYRLNEGELRAASEDLERFGRPSTDSEQGLVHLQIRRRLSELEANRSARPESRNVGKGLGIYIGVQPGMHAADDFERPHLADFAATEPLEVPSALAWHTSDISHFSYRPTMPFQDTRPL